MARPPSSLRIVPPLLPEPIGAPIVVDVPSNEIAPGVSFKDGVLHTEHGDGSVTVDFNPKDRDIESKPDEGFYANLCDKLDQSKLDDIAADLLDGIQRDIDSRKEWLDTRAEGIKLLGLKLEQSQGNNVEASSAPLEGMSKVQHPLLLEATIRFQATARGEFLPASGPVKVRNDTPQKPSPPAPQGQAPAPAVPPGLPGAAGAGLLGPPSPPTMAPPAPALAPPALPAGINPAQLAAPNATEVAQPPKEDKDDLAEALEKDFNHYLTVTASEYVADTDRMLFAIGFGGDGFKKVYNCPLRRRPVSEQVDPKDLIVSNSATDLKNCGRVTHRIKMRKSTLKRMQILGAYAKIDLETPRPDLPDVIEKELDEIDGVNQTTKKPEDSDYTVFECYCELDLDQFAPAHLKDEGLPLPYRVTIDKTSRNILSIIRNWEEDDKEALAKQFFVQFPFIRGLGFYGYGYIHILGNLVVALTAVVREMLDAGMFGNFPGFIYEKSAGRQLSNKFRIPPGGGVPIDAGVSGRIQDKVMPLPYKEPGAAFISFGQWLEQTAQRLAQTADVAVGEGKQEAPVGTTLALIEQATKVLDSVHKRLHVAQDEEFQLLKKRFKEDPEAFWRHNRRPAMAWEREQFLKALDDYNLVPVADPNNPTALHRVMKAAVVEGLAQKYPQNINLQNALERVFRVAGIDSEGLFYPSPLPPPPDPRMRAIEEKAKSTEATMRSQQETKVASSLATMITQMKQLESKAADRESQERIEVMRHNAEMMLALQEREDKKNEARMDLIKRLQEMHMDDVQHQQGLAANRQEKMQDLGANLIERAHDMRASRMERAHEHQADMADRAHEARMTHLSAAQDHAHEDEKHRRQMNRDQEAHAQKLKHERELNAEKVKAARAMARTQPKTSGSKTTTKTTKSNATGTRKTETTKTKED